MEARAIAKYVRISPLKVQSICSEIRGLQADKALTRLEFTTRRGAKELYKVLKSAVANAENGLSLDRADLYIKETYASGGPAMKRFRPRARGTTYLILKRSSRIGMIVTEREQRGFRHGSKSKSEGT